MKNKIFNNKTYSRFGILSACLSLAACDLSQLNVALKDITNSLSLNCSNMEEGALVFKDFYLKEKLDAGLSCEESRVSLAAQQCQNEVLVSIPISKEIVSTCSNSSSSTAPKNCGDLSDGGKETKEFYASATVPYGELCGLKSPLLVRECVDGVEKNYLEEIKASGKSETCTVLAQPPVAGGSVVSVSNQWKNVAIADQNKSFQLSFDLKVSEATSDVVVGLSNKEVSAYQHLAPILRFNKNGVIDARDGSSYKADANVAYTAGETYRIDLEVHLGSGLNYYSVKARAKTATSTSVVANKFGFRTENASPTNLNSLAAYALVGTAELSNINVQAIASPTVTPPTPTPVAYVLSVAKTGTGTGVVSGTGINCGADCSESVASGSTVALSASASSGSTFQGWGGACTGTQSVCSVSMSQARQVSATFTLVPVDNNPPDNTPTTPPVASSGNCADISQHGITWTFDKSYPCGTFANGDYWVVGPVKITKITRPNNSPDLDGSMLGPQNPLGWEIQHGFDGRAIEDGAKYNSSLNVAKNLPLTVAANRSLISSISKANPKDIRAAIEHQAVLTVLSSAAPAGSFRPTYFGTDKSIKWNKKNIDFSKLKTSVSSSFFDLSAMEALYDRPLIILGGKDNYKFENIIASSNAPIYPSGYVYGREMSLAASRAGLALNSNLSNSAKEKLAIHVIQAGLDIYGGVALGNYFDANEGHANGYKLPMLLAGVLLNDSNIISKANGALENFSEDQQHFYVSAYDVNTPRIGTTSAGTIGCRTKNVPCDRPVHPYTTSMIGMAEFGGFGSTQFAGSQWGVIYRDVAGPNLVGNALVCHIMGIENLWNDPAFFDYMNERAWPNFSEAGRIDGFTTSAWTALRSQVGKAPAGY